MEAGKNPSASDIRENYRNDREFLLIMTWEITQSRNDA